MLKRLEDGTCDLDFESMDLVTTDGLENAVILSLGTFARERSLDNVPTNLKPVRGGWWGDALDDKGTLGGNLYEVLPSKGTDASLREVEKLAGESLQWLVDDGIAKSVVCTAKFKGSLIVFGVVIVKPDGDESNFAYEMNWEATRGI